MNTRIRVKYKAYRTSRVSFYFKGERYRYFDHDYNATWRNERRVEVPIIRRMVVQYPPQEVLEAGNVLSHYFSVSHDIVDKYEVAENVINIDVVDYCTTKKYNLIVSISTLEHIGWDEPDIDLYKVLRAIAHLKTCLAPRGKIVITVPVGYNPYLDRFIENGQIHFLYAGYLRRISNYNTWIEVSWHDARRLKYGYPYSCAHGLVIGIIGNK